MSETGAHQDEAARQLLREAGKLLGHNRDGIPPGFIDDLFGRTGAEDLLAYGASELARLAGDAFDHLARRPPGDARLRIATPDAAPADRRLGSVSVLEIANDDMPFLVDSVMGELAEQGLEIRLVAHPVFALTRDAGGVLTAYHGAPPAPAGASRESFIHIHVERIDDPARSKAAIDGLAAALADVRLAVEDWRAMMTRVAEVTAELRTQPPLLPVEEIAEAVQFLDWLTANNFTFLGVRDYTVRDDGRSLPEPDFATGLGIMRDRTLRVLQRGRQIVAMTPEIQAVLQEKQPLIISKAGARARVHRRVDLDYIGIKRFDGDGRLIGETRIVGLFTSTAYTRSTRTIPYLRRKVDAVLRRAGFDPEGHSGKALVNVLETYPRDELFQLDVDTLADFAFAVLQLDERPRLRVLPRRDRFDRFVSVIVFVPRERYDSRVRGLIGDYLARAYNGFIDSFRPYFAESPLVRVHFIVGRNAGEAPFPDQAQLEREIEALVRTWIDNFVLAVHAAYPSSRAAALIGRYRHAFSAGYRDLYAPATAAADLAVIESLTDALPLGVHFHPRPRDEADGVGLKIWSRHEPIPLSERVPVLENMGFRVVDERTYRIEPATDAPVWFHDMVLETADGAAIDLAGPKARLEAAFLVVMSGGAESDGYNALVLASALGWREVALIRTVSRYLHQLRVPFSQDYMWATLRKHAGIAEMIVRLFAARFDPRSPADERAARESAMAGEIDGALKQVDSLDEDRILRHFVAAMRAAIRTNFYQIDRDGRPKALIAIKFASRQLDLVPLPRPLYEIFVYSPRVEGVHLRFGKVARGGIRWSDRPQDFRTEILGLVKAQQVKNAVIVPVGAKGGFVPKWLPRLVARGAGREAIQAEGVAAYRSFIASLLDITDNIGANGIVPPANVVRHEGDDPYLVVAADKGTATFSDIANAISVEHGFWLGDAFASGGSAGYDHKKMGITARGAWVAVKRHFREMDIDIGATPFSVAGVGDMSGDVFGNGMLREATIRLVAAFDHRDIFIDPDPDPAKSFAERKRLFDLPRSSWQDYDKALISAGGGVFPRSAKAIALSPQAQAAIGLKQASATPQEVMSAILKAPVDLLFFGGIGTYVRASHESNDQVGDRANDPIRISGAELRAKVIGEGANLGMTQRGRIEAAQQGVRLNTDAIDNSAGVNTSDLEVNLKIALARPVGDGSLAGGARNDLLAAMTDEVARLVLRNNYQQTLAISLAERRGLSDLGFQQRLMQILETRGELNRAVEFLPDEMELEERRRRARALTRPEIAVLLSYAKLSLNEDLLESDVPDDRYFGRELQRYFPPEAAARYPDALEHHRLRREIIATQLGNSMINRGGPSFVVRIADQTGAAPAAIAAAFAAVRGSYDMIALHGEIDALDAKVPGDLQLDLYAAVQDVLLDRVVWFLRNVDLTSGLETVIGHYREGVAAVDAVLDQVLSKEALNLRAARLRELAAAGVPEALARRIANLPSLLAAPDITFVAGRTQKPVADVAATYFAAGAFFRLDRVIEAARTIKVADYFDRLALDRSLDSIGDAERRLTGAMATNGAGGAAAVETWVDEHRDEVERVRMAIHEIAGTGLTLSKLAVAASLLGDLVRQ